MYSDAGGEAKVIQKSDFPSATNSGHLTVLGWDSVGPLAGTGVIEATQNAGPAGWDSPVYHVDLQGNRKDQLGGVGCYAQTAVENAVLCSSGPYAKAPSTVVDASGKALFDIPGQEYGIFTALMASGEYAAFGDGGLFDPATASNGLYGRDGSHAVLPNNFYSQGFADTTLFGMYGDLNSPALSTIETAGGRPGPVRKFPIQGTFGGYLVGN
jgi:hypothetical protein